MGNVFPPQFGVPLTSDELNSNIPTSILYGVTPSNEFIPIKIDAAGSLAFSGTISVGTVTIEGIDPVGSSTHPLAVVNFGPDGYALRTAIFDEGNQLKVNSDGSINVNTSLALTNVGLVNTFNAQINPATEDTLNNIKTQTDKFTFLATRLLVDGSQVTQPISGNVIVSNFPVTQPVSGTITATIEDTAGNPLTSTTGSLNVNITGGSFSGPTTIDNGSIITGQIVGLDSSLLYGFNGITWERIDSSSNRLIVDGSQVVQPISGTVSVSNFPSTQPVSGTVTANQGTSPWIVSGTVITSPNVNVHDGAGVSISSTGNSLNVDVTNTVPVTLASTTITGTVAVTQNTSPWVVSGTVTANAGTGNFTVVQSTGSNLHVDIDNFPSIQTIAISQSGTDNDVDANITNSTLAVTQSGTWTVQQGTPPWSVSQSGVWSTGRTWVLSSGTDSVNVDNFPATQAVTQSTSPWIISGIVTANIGTTNGLALDTSVNGILVSQGSTTLGAKGPLIQGAVTTSAPSYTTGQTNPISLTTSGALRTDSSATIQPVSGTVAATQSGPWTVSLTSESIEIGTVDQGTPNIIANAWPVAPTDGVHSQSFTASGEAKVSVTQPLPAGTNIIGHVITDSGSTTVVTGTVAVTQSTSPWVISGSVTANIGTTGGLALDTSVNGILVSQGSTTSGEKGPLIQGAVTTSAPAYTTAQTSPLSLTTSGALRTDSSATTQPVSGTVTANAGTGNFTVVQPTGTNLHTVLDSGTLTSITNALPSGTNVIGHVITDSGSTTVVTGNVTVVQGTGTNLHTVVDSGSIVVTQSTAANLNATVIGTVTANQGTPNTIANKWPIAIVDSAGTNVATVNATNELLVTDTDLTLSQGSTTSGQLGTLIQGAVTTSAPSYTTAQTNPLSLTTTGDLRTVAKLQDGSGNAISSNSGALNGNLTQVGGVSVAATSKGIQATNFVPAQAPKDTGRTYVTFTMDAVAGVITTEALFTFTLNKQGTTTASQTNYTITTGKTLRIQTISVGIQSNAGAGEWVRVKLRHNTSGATTTASALVYTVACGTPSNQIATGGQVTVPIPDGLEIFGNGTQTIGVSHISSATTNIESVTICGYEY